MKERRLEDLQRQKALIEEHLNWLNAEIESLQNTDADVAADQPLNRLEDRTVSPGNVFIPKPKTDEEPDPQTAISDIYDELGPETKASVKDARKGCLAIFAVAFLALGLLATWVWIKY